MKNIIKHPAGSRGKTDIGWLKSWHSFSFGEYYDPDHMGFRALRVINDDYVAPNMGFGMHGHRDMEIFTYVVDGELEHKDSMGNGSVIKAGRLQYMSAGSGVRHSEFNPSRDKPVHLYQVWIEPYVSGAEPRYAEFDAAAAVQDNALTLMLAADAAPVAIRQDARVSLGRLGADKTLPVALAPDRHAWIQLIKGKIETLGESLEAGDALQISGVPGDPAFEIKAAEDAEFLLFDLA